MRKVSPSRTGSNVVRVGSHNQAVVLDVIRRAKSISRVEIAALTGLASQTVTNICRRLIDDGFIMEAGKVATAMGKPRTAITLRPGSYYAVGVLLDPDASSVVLLDLAGDVRARSVFSHSYSEEPEEVVATVSDRVRRLLEGAEVDPLQVLGIGIGAPGPIDVERGAVREPPNLPMWQDVPLRDLLGEATGHPVVLDKDVVAAAVAESWYGRGERHDTTAVVYVGTGVGLGVCLEGEVFRGTSGNAGEIGHVIVDPDGPECGCGARGCVAVTSAPSALAERFANQGSGVDEVMGELVRRAPGEPLVAEGLAAAGEGLARLARTVADVYDINRIIFGGPMWRHFTGLLDAERLESLGASLGERLGHRVSCRPSMLGEDLGAIGAACLVFDTFLSPGTARLMLGSGSGPVTGSAVPSTA